MTDHDIEHCLDCSPSPAELGDTLTVDPRVWTPLDDHGTQLYVYGNQAVDIAVQIAPIDDEIRQLRKAFNDIERHLDQYRGPKALREGAQAIVDRVRGIPSYLPDAAHEHDGYCLNAGGACSPEAQETDRD